MQAKVAVMELTDEEIRILSPLLKAKLDSPSAAFEFDRLPLPAGVISGGVVRDPAKLAAMLKEHFGRSRGTRRAFIALGGQQVLMRVWDLPWLPKRKRSAMVRFLLSDELSLPAHQLLWDYGVLVEDREANVLRILVGAAKRSLLEPYLAACRLAGLRVQGVDLALAALAFGLELPVQGDHLYLAGADRLLQVVLFRGVVPELVWAVAVDPVWAEPVAGLANEVRRILLLAGVDNLESVAAIISNGEAAELVAAALAPAGKRRAAAAWTPIEVSGEPGSPASGAGLVAWSYWRRLANKAPGLNLMAQELKERRLAGNGLALLVSGVILFLLAGGAHLYWRQEESHLRAEVERLRHQGIAAQEVGKRNRELQSQWTQALQRPHLVAGQIEAVQQLTSPSVFLERIQFKDGGLFLKGGASRAKDVENLLAGLRRIGWEHPILTDYASAQTIEFAIKAQR